MEENSREPEFIDRPRLGWSVGPQGRTGVAKSRGGDGENGFKGGIGHHHRQYDAGKSEQDDPNEQHTNHQAHLLLFNHFDRSCESCEFFRG